MDDFISHYGVLGMKWGVRKEHSSSSLNPKFHSLKTRNKDGEISLEKDPSPLISRGLSRISGRYRSRSAKLATYSIKDRSGKKVGDLQLSEESPNELNVVWVGVNKSQRGHGTATSTMKAVQKSAKKMGYKKVTLEVPGNSPDARHIYEKLGFKDKGKIDNDEDDVWGGLTKMEYDMDEHISHYGVLGMKWGVRKDRSSSSKPLSAHKASVKREKSWKNTYEKRSKMSDEQLRKAVNRLQLENQFAQQVQTASSLSGSGKKFLSTKSKLYLASTVADTAVSSFAPKNEYTQLISAALKGANAITKPKK